MAKITPSPLVSSVAGSVGGVTFRTVRGKTIAQTRTPGRAYGTTRAREHQSYLYRAHAAWRAFSPALQQGWNLLNQTDTSARTVYGKVLHSGRELFFSWYLAMLHLGRTPPLDTIPDVPLFFPVTFKVNLYQVDPAVWSAGDVSVYRVFYGINELTPAMALWMNWPAAPGIRPSKRWHKILPPPHLAPVRNFLRGSSYIDSIVGPPREFWGKPYGEYIEQYVPSIRGLCDCSFSSSSPSPFPATSVGVMPPILWRAIGFPWGSGPPWPADYVYKFADPEYPPVFSPAYAPPWEA